MNLFKKTTAAVALVTLVSGIFSTGVSAYSTSEVGAANALAEAGIINNHSDNSAAYNLDQNVLRQEIAAVARGIAGLPKATTYSAVFSDVTATTPNTWAWASVNALADAGLVAKNPTFRPEANISKAEAVGMVVKAAFGDAYAFDAAKGTTWQEQVVAFAVENGVVSSFTNYDTAATRGFVFEAGANALSSDDDSMDGLLEDLLGGLTDDEETTTDDETTVTTPVVDGDDMLEVALSPETPTLGYVAAGRDRTTVLAFDVTAGSEDVTLKEATLEYVGLSDAANFTVLSIYLGNEKATKGTTKKFTNNEVDLAFENETVIKAGETQTLYVTANVANSASTVSHKIALTNLDASSTVEGDYVVSNSFGVVNSANVATLSLDVNTQTSKVTVGKESTLADFSLEEKNDKEDVTLKSLTFDFSSGGLDAEDDLTDLALYADGKIIASNLMVNSDDEVIVDVEFTIPQDETVDFELKGTVTSSIGEVFDAKLTDIYAIGAKTGLIVSLAGDTMSTLLSEVREIEGSEINVSFDKSDIDEAKPNADQVLVGTLELSSVSDYTIDTLEVTVTSGTGVDNVIKTLELNGSSSDSDNATSTGLTAVYTFEDISLAAGETKSLDLTFDVNDNVALNGNDVTFAVKIVKVTDEENDESYIGTTALNTVLSSNSFNNKTIDIQTARLTLTQTTVSQRTLVIGNGVEVVLYKGKLSVGDSDDVTLKDLTLTGTLNNSGAVSVFGTYDYEDILDDVTLNIGGKTFDGDINAQDVKFKSINAVVTAGSDNVEVTVTAVLKDNDSVSNGDLLVLDNVAVVAKDSENEQLVSTNVTVANNSDTTLKLNELGTLTFKVVQNGDNKDEIDDVVLAGTNGVALAEVEFEADEENAKVQELVFTASGDVSSTLENVRLVNGSNVIVDGAVIAYNTSGTYSGMTTVTFKNDFTVDTSSNKVKAVLVADLNNVSTEGGTVSANTSTPVEIALITVDAKWVASNEDLTVSGLGATTSLAVTVVPVLVTVSIVDELGTNDSTALVRFTVDKGNNDLTNSNVYVKSISLESAASGVVVRNDDNEEVIITDNTASTLAVDLSTLVNRELAKIVNGDEYELKVATDADELRINKYGISIVVDLNGNGTADAGETFKISNDKVIDLGEYDAN